MDKIDIAILTIVRENARIPVKQISGRINLSVPATSERLRKLEKAGYIKGYTVVVDHEKLGKGLCCFCLLVLATYDAHINTEFLAYVEQTDDILECHRVTGTYEYLLKIKTSSTRSLEALLATLRERWGVTNSLTYTVLSSLKEDSAAIPDQAR